MFHATGITFQFYIPDICKLIYYISAVLG